MKTFLSLSAFVAAVSAQTGVFEPADFNVTEALIANGVNVSAIPQLSALVERSFLGGCSIAVSFPSGANLRDFDIDVYVVLLLEAYLWQQ
jgi:hypothetical protein